MLRACTRGACTGMALLLVASEARSICCACAALRACAGCDMLGGAGSDRDSLLLVRPCSADITTPPDLDSRSRPSWDCGRSGNGLKVWGNPVLEARLHASVGSDGALEWLGWYALLRDSTWRAVGARTVRRAA